MRRTFLVLFFAASSACDYGVHVASLRVDAGRADAGTLEATPSPGSTVELFLDGSQILGDSVAYVDLDGDGMDDIVIPDRQSDPATHRGGGLYIVYGRAARLPARVDLATEAVHVLGPTHDAGGNGVIPVRGDFDGDGREDLAVAVGYGTATSGTVHVIYGASERLSGTQYIEDLGPTLDGSDWLAETLASLGDLDGDGCDELAMGGTNAGVVVVMRGSRARWSGRAPAEIATVFGADAPDIVDGVQSAGDLDGDGSGDVIAIDEAGHFGIFYGPITLAGMHAMREADATIAVTTNNSPSLVARDLDGDGYGDIVVSDPRGADAVVDVFLGGARRFVGAYASGDAAIQFAVSPTDAHGVTFSSGDGDGDGHVDLLVGLPAYSGGDGVPVGSAYRVAGPILQGGALAHAATQWVGHELPPVDAAPVVEGLGYAVALDGDFDGDGLADALLTAPTNDVGGVAEHRVYLAYGSR